MKLLRAAACFGLCAFALSTHAGLFLPKNTRMAMVMYAPDAQSAELSYGFTRDLSGTAGWHRYENDDGDVRRDYYVLRANVPHSDDEIEIVEGTITIVAGQTNFVILRSEHGVTPEA